MGKPKKIISSLLDGSAVAGPGGAVAALLGGDQDRQRRQTQAGDAPAGVEAAAEEVRGGQSGVAAARKAPDGQPSWSSRAS